MSSRPLIVPFQVIADGDMSADVVSKVSFIQQISYISFDISWTGTPTGTFTVEVSNSYKTDGSGNVINAGNWTPLTLSAATAAVGAAGNGFIDIDGVAAYAIRLRYTRAAGTGVLNAVVVGKVI